MKGQPTTLSVDRFEVSILEIPMRIKVQHHLAERAVARSVIVHARSAEGISGFGECCPREYVTGETEASVEHALREDLLPRWRSRSWSSFDDVVQALRKELEDLPRETHAAFCAFELAMLDLAGRCFARSAGSVLGSICDGAPRYGGVIAAEEPAAARKMATRMRELGAQDVKVKVGAELERNRALLAAAREVLGPQIELRIDANGAWTAEEALRQLAGFAEFQLTGCEQPVARDDVAGMATVTAARLMPIIADETLCSFADAQALIARRACDVFNLRVSKCGGLLNVARIHALAAREGIECQLGAQVGEAGFLSAAGRHVATRLPGLRWREGSYGRLLLEEDVVAPDLTIGKGGVAPPLEGDGLGVQPIAERFAARSQPRFVV